MTSTQSAVDGPVCTSNCRVIKDYSEGGMKNKSQIFEKKMSKRYELIVRLFDLFHVKILDMF